MENCSKKGPEFFVSPSIMIFVNILGQRDFFLIILSGLFWSPDFKICRFSDFQILRFSDFRRRQQKRWTNSQIPTWPLSQCTQGSNRSQGARRFFTSITFDYILYRKDSEAGSSAQSYHELIWLRTSNTFFFVAQSPTVEDISERVQVCNFKITLADC